MSEYDVLLGDDAQEFLNLADEKMGYMIKLQSNIDTGGLFRHMATKTRVDDRERAIDPERSLPVGTTPPAEASHPERSWGHLFNHGGDTRSGL